MQIVVTVALKEVSHQVPVTLPTCVSSDEMKNYRKEKKHAVSPVLERGMGCIILDTQLWLQPKLSSSVMPFVYRYKKPRPLSACIFST